MLLDTHAFLWWIADPDHAKLSSTAKDAIADEQNDIIFSVASGWELAIKASLGRLEVPELKIPKDFGQFIVEQAAENDFEVLSVSLDHAMGVYELPYHHRDPFDRLLIAQALAEGIPLLSKDSEFPLTPWMSSGSSQRSPEGPTFDAEAWLGGHSGRDRSVWINIYTFKHLVCRLLSVC